MGPDCIIDVDKDVWPYFNRSSFDQDKIVSYGQFQYTLYWANDEVLVLVWRNLDNDTIETFRFLNMIAANWAFAGQIS